MTIVPFWFSTEHRSRALTPFWLSADDMKYTLLYPCEYLWSCVLCVSPQIIPLHQVMQVANSDVSSRFLTQLKAVAFSVFTQCRRYQSPTIPGRSLTGFGPAADLDRMIISKNVSPLPSCCRRSYRWYPDNSSPGQFLTRTIPHQDNSPPYRYWSWWVVLLVGSGPGGELS